LAPTGKHYKKSQGAQDTGKNSENRIKTIKSAMGNQNYAPQQQSNKQKHS